MHVISRVTGALCTVSLVHHLLVQCALQSTRFDWYSEDCLAGAIMHMYTE